MRKFQTTETVNQRVEHRTAALRCGLWPPRTRLVAQFRQRIRCRSPFALQVCATAHHLIQFLAIIFMVCTPFSDQ